MRAFALGACAVHNAGFVPLPLVSPMHHGKIIPQDHIAGLPDLHKLMLGPFESGYDLGYNFRAFIQGQTNDPAALSIGFGADIDTVAAGAFMSVDDWMANVRPQSDVLGFRRLLTVTYTAEPVIDDVELD